MKDSFENILLGSKRKQNLFETDRGKEFYIKNFQNFLNNNNIKHYSRNTLLGAVFAKRFDRTIRDLPKRPFFGRGGANWIDILTTKTIQYHNWSHFSTKLTTMQASWKKNEGFVCKHILDKRNRIPIKFQVNDLVRAADLKKKTFLKRDRTNWSHKLLKIVEIKEDTISSHRLDKLKKRYNEALLEKTELTMKENETVLKASNLN